MALTDKQRGTLARVLVATARSTWAVATSSGERVTLASLHASGWLTRRARRGVEGHQDAAYAYQAQPHVLEAARAAGLLKEIPCPAPTEPLKSPTSSPASTSAGTPRSAPAPTDGHHPCTPVSPAAPSGTCAEP